MVVLGLHSKLYTVEWQYDLKSNPCCWQIVENSLALEIEEMHCKMEHFNYTIDVIHGNQFRAYQRDGVFSCSILIDLWCIYTKFYSSGTKLLSNQYGYRLVLSIVSTFEDPLGYTIHG